MTRFNGRFIVDGYGNRVGVLLDMQEYRKIMDDLEELDSIKAYDAAKASGDEPYPSMKLLERLSRIANGW